MIIFIAIKYMDDLNASIALFRRVLSKYHKESSVYLNSAYTSFIKKEASTDFFQGLMGAKLQYDDVCL